MKIDEIEIYKHIEEKIKQEIKKLNITDCNIQLLDLSLKFEYNNCNIKEVKSE